MSDEDPLEAFKEAVLANKTAPLSSQEIVEEKLRNEKRRELLLGEFQSQYADLKTRQTKLDFVKMELLKLDQSLMTNIDLIRTEIEKQDRETSELRCNYDRLQREFYEVKNKYEKGLARKKLLTEHLDLIILTNEKAKALKLSQLMDKMGLDHVPQELQMPSYQQVRAETAAPVPVAANAVSTLPANQIADTASSASPVVIHPNAPSVSSQVPQPLPIPELKPQNEQPVDVAMKKIVDTLPTSLAAAVTPTVVESVSQPQLVVATAAEPRPKPKIVSKPPVPVPAPVSVPVPVAKTDRQLSSRIDSLLQTSTREPPSKPLTVKQAQQSIPGRIGANGEFAGFSTEDLQQLET